MGELEGFIEDFLSGSEKVAVLGAGSVLMSDDAAGILVTEHLIGAIGKRNNLKIMNGCTAPENFTGEIKDHGPDRLIVLDAADMKEKPGSIMIIDPDVIEGVTFSTHMLPLKVMLNYLKKEIGCRVLILGIQPLNAEFGTVVSQEVLEAVDELKCVLENKLTKFD
jgi:hydrogenase 3 maturation protease